MSHKKYFITIVTLAAVFLALSIITTTFYNYVDVVVSNYLAVGQLENDAIAFARMTFYTNTLKPIVSAVYGSCIAILITIGTLTTIKFCKHPKETL